MLIDAGSYFAQLEAALRRARRSILIIGWDFDGRIRLRPDDSHSKSLGELLRSLVDAHPELELRILVWSVAVLHAPGAARPLLLGDAWQEHPRIHVRLDRFHPIYAAHHQKIVCIDDALAFAGGMDLTVRRWDTSRHIADDPRRIGPDGTHYGPVHDIQMVVDHEAAHAVSELGHQRWKHATGERLREASAREDPWPPDLDPDVTDTPIAIARTAPAWRGRPAIGEAATLTADALAAARHSIYIETQYLTAPSIGDRFAESLDRETGPEIVILTTRTSRGPVERFVMGKNRDRLIRRLKRADRFDRLRVYHPVVPAVDGERQVMIHSKLIIVDDVFVRVGSSNLNNRSIGLDTECDLAIEAHEDTTRNAIAKLRNRLVAEHLGVGEQDFEGALEGASSLIGAVERLNTGPRGLRSFGAAGENGPSRPILGTRLLDPKRPFEPLGFLRRRRRKG